MTDWFIMNLAVNSCCNDTVLTFKYESQKLSKDEPKERKRTDRGIRTLIYSNGLAQAIKYSFHLLSKFSNFKDNRYQNQKAMKFDPVPYTNHYVPKDSDETESNTKDYRSMQSELRPVKIYKPLDEEGEKWSVITSSKSSVEALATIFVEMLEHSDEAADSEDYDQPEFWIFNSLISKIDDLRFLEAKQQLAKDEFTEFTQIYSEDEYPKKELFNEWFVDENLVKENKYETKLTKELNRLEKIKNKRERWFFINDKRIYLPKLFSTSE